VVEDKEHATDGTHALKLANKGEMYVNFHDRGQRRSWAKFKDYVLLRIDMFKPAGCAGAVHGEGEDARARTTGRATTNDYNVALAGEDAPGN